MNLETADFLLRLVASLLAIIGAYIAVIKYLDEKRKANETARIESRKPFSAKQQEIYFELVSTASLLSSGNPSKEQFDAAVKHFWVLFWGAVPMVADEDVAKAIDSFAEALDHPELDIALRNASMEETMMKHGRGAPMEPWQHGGEGRVLGQRPVQGRAVHIVSRAATFRYA
jgi:hypothetical protein